MELVRGIIFRYAFIWLPAITLLAVACRPDGLCSCSYTETPQICNEDLADAAETARVGTVAALTTAHVRTLTATTYAPQPTVEMGTATMTVVEPSTPLRSLATPSFTSTLVPPDPRISRTSTPLPPATRGPNGLPLTVENISVDRGGCYVAVVDTCHWQEYSRKDEPGLGLVVLLRNDCCEGMVAHYQVESRVLRITIS